MSYSMGPRRVGGGMLPNAFMMGYATDILDPDDFDTDEEYQRALKAKGMEDEESKRRMNFGRYANGMMPDTYWLGGSEYGDAPWIDPRDRKEDWNNGRGV